MKRTPRSNYKSGFFHIMVQGINKSYIFEKNIDKEDYLSILLTYKNKFEITLLAYCIMDNHAHLLIYTNKINEMSKYMRTINSKFGRNYNKSTNRVGYVFRDRFNSQYIDTKEYLIKCLNYIHINPVVANMVKNPSEYKYSSYNNYLKKMGNVTDEVINKLFDNPNNYLSSLKDTLDEEIEIMDIDRDEKNFIIAVEKYLLEKNVTFELIKHNKTLLSNFCKYLTQKQYKYSQIAKLLQIDRKKIYYAIKSEKD